MAFTHSISSRKHILTGMVSSLAMCAALVMASPQARAQKADMETVNVSIPSTSVSKALIAISRSYGTDIIGTETVVGGKQSTPVSGELTLPEALTRSLRGTGLTYRQSSTGAYLVVEAETHTSNAATRQRPIRVDDIIDVEGREFERFIAPDANVGILGSKSFLDTPFNVTSYTEEFVQNLQARSLLELLDSSPTVSSGFGNKFSQNDQFLIRGFQAGAIDIAFDGVFGVTNQRRVSIAAVSNVEVLKGPSALLYGLAPGGSIGGVINLVPKKAQDTPTTNVSVFYVQDANFGGSVDIGRRFGDEDSIGVRFNAVYRDGDVALDFASEKETLVSLAVDYRSDTLRAAAFLNYEDIRNEGSIFGGFGLAQGLPVPPAPDNATNPGAPYSFVDVSRIFGKFNVDWEFARQWTASLAFGFTEADETQLANFGRNIINLEGDVTEPFDRLRSADRPSRVYNANINGQFETAGLSHEVVVTASRLRFVDDTFFDNRVPPGSTLSNIYVRQSNLPAPDFTTDSPNFFGEDRLNHSVGIADTISAWDGRAQLTIGVRRQWLKSSDVYSDTVNFDTAATTPAVAAAFKVDDQVSIYANYIQGFSFPPEVPEDATNFDEIFPPARSRQFELGAKFDIESLRGVVSIFQIEQPSGIVDPQTGIFSTDGNQRHRGIELEVFGDIGENVRIIGGVTYLDAKLENTENGVNEGNRVFGIPEWVVSLTSEVDVPAIEGLTLTGRLIYNSDRFLDNGNTQLAPSWTRFDLGGRYRFELQNTPITLRAQVTNAFDQDFWRTAQFSLRSGTPRYLSLSATAEF